MRFDQLPLNTGGVYVMEKTAGGCEIYIPVVPFDEAYIQRRKQSLRQYLGSQAKPEQPDGDLSA